MSTPIFSWSEHEAPDRAYYLTRQISNGPYSYRTHTHTDQTELVFVARGRLEHVLNGRLFVLEPGWAQLVREADSHSLRGTGLEFYNLAFPSVTKGPLGDFFGSGPRDRWNHLVSAPFVAPFRFEVLGIGNGEEVLRNLCDHYDPWIFLRILAGTFEELTRSAAPEASLGGYVFEEQPGSFAGARTLAALPPWLADLAATLANADPIPTASQLPALTGMSAAHLSRTFQRQWGISPSAYLNRLRLDRAAALLRSRKMSMSQVALEAGFVNSNYFHKLFRARFGISPRDFAKGNR